MTTKRFDIQYDGYRYFVVVDIENERGIARMDTMSDAEGFLEMYEILNDDIEQLKQRIKELRLLIENSKEQNIEENENKILEENEYLTITFDKNGNWQVITKEENKKQ